MPSNAKIIDAATPKIKEFATQYQETFEKNVQKVFLAEALPALKAAYITVYDRLADTVESRYPPRIKGKDKLSLVAQRPLFVSNLDRQLAGASFDGGEFNLSLKLTGAEDADGRPTSPDSLNFYIEGAIGRYAFITPEHLKQRRPTSEASRGRLSEGFIISQRNYVRERWEELTGVSFDEVQHPISGFSPFEDFEEVPGSIDFGVYVRKALEQTDADLNGTTV